MMSARAENQVPTIIHVEHEFACIKKQTPISRYHLSRHYDRAEECFQWAREQYLVKEVATDDILDAMVGAVTAMQYPRLSTLPTNPVSDEEGIPMEIVYCGDF
jgi:predicted RNase H-like nuclease